MSGWDMFEYRQKLLATDLPPAVKGVLQVLMFVPTRGGDGLADHRDMSSKGLAKLTSYNRATVLRSLAIAEARGWCEAARRGRGRRTAYRLTIPAEGVDNFPNVSHHATCGQLNVSHHATPTCRTTRHQVSHHATPSYPFLTEVPSIVERVRARVRGACPDLTPDDDDLDLLIKNLENRTPNPVSNVAGYLQHCPPADIRRLLADAKPQIKPATTEAWTAADEWCEAHDHPGGTTTAGTKRCPQCRRAAQHGRSAPFSPSLDGLDRPGGPKPADGLSEPLSEAVAG